MISKKIESINTVAIELYKYAIQENNNYLEERSLQIIKDINFIDELSKESNIAIPVDNSHENEIKKVKRKVPLWLKRQHQYNYIILSTYMNLSNQNQEAVLLTQLEIESNLTPIMFYRHYNLMKNIFEKNHAKVFEEDKGKVFLWTSVSEYIENVFSKEELC